MNWYLLISIFFASSLGWTKEFKYEERVKHLNWKDLEVVWLEDDRFPTFNISIYFADGALRDGPTNGGATSYMFQLLDRGTNRYTYQQITDALEYFGTEYGGEVFHDYSTFQVSGLMKNLAPTMKMVCHLFNDAIFPVEEVQRYREQQKNILLGLSNEHSALANRIFRELSLKETPFGKPATGKLKEMANIKQKDLMGLRRFFHQNVKKKIYLTGPKNILSIQEIITEECGWKNQNGKFVRTIDYMARAKLDKPQYYLATLADANQAQVRIGRFLSQNEIERPDRLALVSNFLGGGFSSMLMRTLRVQHGLTYSVNAYAGGQKYYGRAVIATFTKNSSVEALITQTQATLAQLAKGDFGLEDFRRLKNNLVGGHLFAFESNTSLLGQILQLDYQQRDYSWLWGFADKVAGIDERQVAADIELIFNPNQQIYLVLGPQMLLKDLKKLGDFKILDYRNFL